MKHVAWNMCSYLREHIHYYFNKLFYINIRTKLQWLWYDYYNKNNHYSQIVSSYLHFHSHFQIPTQFAIRKLKAISIYCLRIIANTRQSLISISPTFPLSLSISSLALMAARKIPSKMANKAKSSSLHRQLFKYLIYHYNHFPNSCNNNKAK